ncbi:MAG: hypothetical protein AAF288_10895 [Planctomycetota bacterium]
MPDAHLLPTPHTPAQRTAWAQAGATVFKQVVALDTAALGFYALFADRFAPAPGSTAGW